MRKTLLLLLLSLILLAAVSCTKTGAPASKKLTIALTMSIPTFKEDTVFCELLNAIIKSHGYKHVTLLRIYVNTIYDT